MTMKYDLRWVYVFDAHVIGIGSKGHLKGAYEGFWKVIVLPDWMSQGFIDRLPREYLEPELSRVDMVVPEDHLIMGETVRTLVIEEGESEIWRGGRPAYARILLDGVLIWGMEEYPGERKIVVPRVKIPKKLREGGEL